MSDSDFDKEALEAFQLTSLKRELAERETQLAAQEAALAASEVEFAAFQERRPIRLAEAIAGPLARIRGALTGSRNHEPLPVEAAPSEPAPADPPLFYWPSLVHFHSPVPDTRILSREPTRSRLWPEHAPEQPGLEWRGDAQLRLVREELAQQEPMVFPEQPTEDPTEFFSSNPAFAPHDAWALQAMLRHLRPRRMIETGSGWTSLLAARVNREHLGEEMELACIDPYPQDFMAGGIDGVTELIKKPVEEMPVEYFQKLESGDVLFIDSTHTLKTGSDVTFLFGEIIPRLQPGVVIHIHDIFLPGEYPQQWVLSGWSWNEQYLVQAFLAFNDAFEVLLSLGWLAHRHPQVIEEAVPNFERFYPGRGGSLWIRRKMDAAP